MVIAYTATTTTAAATATNTTPTATTTTTTLQFTLGSYCGAMRYFDKVHFSAAIRITAHDTQ